MTIRSRILWILAVPFAGFLGLAAVKVLSDASQWQEANASVKTTISQSLVSSLVHQLQLERGLSSGYLSSKGAQFGGDLATQRPKTDAALSQVTADGGATGGLQGLSDFRGQIDKLTVTGAQSLAFYTNAIDAFLEQIAASAAAATRPETVRKATAYSFFLEVKEFTGQLRATLNGALSAGQFDEAAIRRVDTVLSALQQAQRNFDLFTLQTDQDAVTPVMADAAVAKADSLVAAVLAAPRQGPFPATAAEVFSALTAKIDVMKKADDVLSLRLRTTAQADANQAEVALVFDLAAVVLLALLALILTVRLTGSIRNQLGCEPFEVAAIARSIGQGILNVPPQKKRSTGAYQDLTAMVESLRSQVATLERIAGGDLTVDVVKASDQDRLGLSMESMVESLGEVIRQIRLSVEQLTSGSGQVATASQSLAQGATEQASAVEQINASATEVAHQARRNAETAQSASQAARQARTDASEGKERMRVLIDLVEKMSASSAETQRIVKTIDDIAFQVNLLALNANVEAARAGKYGKGFGVVAEEVRSLAKRSADAVGETTTRVSEILRAIEAVNSTAKLTDGSLDGIAKSASQVADLLDEIATSSRDQAKALEQVRGGLDQIDTVTQSNTASAEQSASAAEELSGQAVELRNQVSRFQVTNDD